MGKTPAKLKNWPDRSRDLVPTFVNISGRGWGEVNIEKWVKTHISGYNFLYP